MYMHPAASAGGEKHTLKSLSLLQGSEDLCSLIIPIKDI